MIDAAPMPLKYQTWRDANKRLWLLCTDLNFWARADALGMLLPSPGRCSSCAQPLEPTATPGGRCRWCR